MKPLSQRIIALVFSLLGASIAFFSLIAITEAGTLFSSIELPNWKASKVDTDSSTSARGNTSIVIAASGQAHMTYVSNQELRYAVLSDTTWITQVVDSEARVLAHSLALDSAATPHIAYVALQPSATTGYLRYATIKDTNWITQTVEDNPLIEGTEGCDVSIAVDGNQVPHISYGAIPNLKYAVFTATGWLTYTVDDAVYGYMCSALDVEESGVAHIAYYDMGPSYGGMLKYTTLSGTLWLSQTVDENPSFDGIDFGLPSALRLDSRQLPHILYYDAPNKQFEYAMLSGTIWLSETIPFPRPVSRQGFMTLDSNDKPHISFAGQYGQDLMYATLTDTQWLSQTIDTSLGAGLANSIALYDEDTIYVSYLNTYLGEVRVTKSWYANWKIFLPLVIKE